MQNTYGPTFFYINFLLEMLKSFGRFFLNSAEQAFSLHPMPGLGGKSFV